MQIISTTGKTTEQIIPALITEPLTLKSDAPKATTSGPIVHPISPPTASRANMAVDLPARVDEARDKVPGHITETANPNTPQHKSAISGFGIRAAPRYIKTRVAEQNIRYLIKLILWAHLL